jgi:hypothetical protein
MRRGDEPAAAGAVRTPHHDADAALISLRTTSMSLLAACAVTLVGCAGSGTGLDPNGRPLPPGGTTGGVLSADFDSIQQHVFTPVCAAVCHAGGAAPQGLRLDAASSYALLVGIPSTEVASVLRVQPGDPGNSYLIQKLEGHAAVGARMPFGGPYLDAATIAIIRQWITDGALRTPAAAATRSFAAQAVTPAPGDVLFEAPVRIVVAFSEELDVTRLDPASVRLEMLARDGAVLRTVPVALRVPRADPRALLIEPAAPLPDGVYRVLVGAAPGTGLSSLSGEQLGGPAAAMPAGTVLTAFEVAVQP